MTFSIFLRKPKNLKRCWEGVAWSPLQRRRPEPTVKEKDVESLRWFCGGGVFGVVVCFSCFLARLGFVCRCWGLGLGEEPFVAYFFDGQDRFTIIVVCLKSFVPLAKGSANKGQDFGFRFPIVAFDTEHGIVTILVKSHTLGIGDGTPVVCHEH